MASRQRKPTPSRPGKLVQARGLTNCLAAVMMPNGLHYVRIVRAFFDVAQTPPRVVRLDVRCFGGDPSTFGGYNARIKRVTDGFDFTGAGLVVGKELKPFHSCYGDVVYAFTRLTDVSPAI